MNIEDWKRTVENCSPGMATQDRLMLALLVEILAELRALTAATEQANEPGPDDEPSPFQSLSG